MNIKITGFDEFQHDIKRLAKTFPRETDAMANKIMLKIEREGAIESPVDTGRLRASIKSKLMGFTKQSYVSTDTNYAVFPHVNNPYMERAVKNSSMLIDQEINNLLDKVL